MRVQLLGPVEVCADDGEFLAIGGPKQRTVLALLCVDPCRPVSSDRLIEGVWGDEVPGRAARSLSTFVSNLHRVMGDAIQSERGTYRVTLDRSCVDVTAFVDLVHLAGTMASSDLSGAARVYREATSMWVGAPFGGIDAHGLLTADITRLEDLRLLAMERALAIELDTGAHRDVVAELEHLVTDYPHHENLRGLHMRALYLCGRQADALASYRTYRERLAADLGLDPSRDLRELEFQILDQDESLGLERPSLLSHVVAGLPLRYSRFVGRDEEVDTTLARMKDHRVVTVTGPGGIGKSSVALEAARTLSDRSDLPIVYAALEQAGDVAANVARSMGLAPGPNVDPVAVVVSYLESHPHLMILDGCEAQVHDVAALVDRVLSSTQSAVLVTSREPLGLNGESIVRIDGLPADDAVEVFRDRAELDADLDDTTLHTVRLACEELDGLPLAIELLAGRARSIPLDRLASKLGSQIPLLRRARSHGDRHGSLLTALDWSYDLLTEPERRTLRAIAVFVTPFSIQDAVAMVGDASVEDDIDRLVEVSLLQPPTSQGNYRFLEPIRQYAAYRLTESNEREVYDPRHAEWIAAAAEHLVSDPTAILPRELSNWIFDNRDEMLAGIDRALEHDEPDIAVRIVAAVGRGVVAIGVHGPWVARARAGVEHRGATRNGTWAIAASHVASMVAIDNGRDAGSELLDRAEAVAESVGDPIALWTVKEHKCVLEGQQKGNEHMLVLFEELERLRPFDREMDMEVEAFCYSKVVALVSLGRFDEAESIIEEQRERWEEHTSTSPWTYHAVMSSIAAYRGELETSLQQAVRAARVAETDRIYGPESDLLEHVGDLADRVDDVTMLQEAIGRHHRIEAITGVLPSIPLEMRFAQAMGRYEEVLELAGAWLHEHDGAVIANDEVMIVGEATEMPRIFAILRPVAFALYALGRTGEACRLAHAVPDLMAESRFAYWDEFRERSLWDPLAEACCKSVSDAIAPSEVCAIVGTMVPDSVETFLTQA